MNRDNIYYVTNFRVKCTDQTPPNFTASQVGFEAIYRSEV